MGRVGGPDDDDGDRGAVVTPVKRKHLSRLVRENDRLKRRMNQALRAVIVAQRSADALRAQDFFARAVRALTLKLPR